MKKLTHSAIAIASAFVVCGQANADYIDGGGNRYIVHDASINIIGNDNNSANGEGVFIRSNTGAASHLYLASDGGVTLGGTTMGINATNMGLNGTSVTVGNTGVGTTALRSALTTIGATTITGATSINTSGADATILGANGNATNLNSNVNNIGTGAYATTNTVGSALATNVIVGATNTITGTTSINASNNAVTNINTGTSTSAVNVGNALNTTNLNSATNNMGVSSGYATANNIGTTSAFASTNRLGSENAGTRVISRGDNSTMEVSKNVASGTVITGTSTLVDATTTTTGQMLIRNTGGTTVDANGKILTSASTGYVNPAAATAAVTLTNGLGNTHGLVVTETQTTLSGGTQSSSMTLNDRAATFSNAQNGNPITVTGVADGRADFDAVNVRQFAGAIAAVAAQANIPALSAGQDRTFGMGVGNFMGKSALAMGMNFRGSANSVYKATVSSGLNNGMKQTVLGVGGAWGF